MLQQPSQGGAAGAVTLAGGVAAGQQGQQPRLVLGSLPGKLVLQGGQLAALTQARTGQTGAQPKVLTIQLQVQQQPNQQGAKVSHCVYKNTHIYTSPGVCVYVCNLINM